MQGRASPVTYVAQCLVCMCVCVCACIHLVRNHGQVIRKGERAFKHGDDIHGRAHFLQAKTWRHEPQVT